MNEKKRDGGKQPPPHDLGAETAVLGAMLLSPDAVDAAMSITRAADFYSPAHANIFAAIAEMYANGERADPTTVASQLLQFGKLEESGGVDALISMMSNTPATSNAARYATLVAEAARMRELLLVSEQIQRIAFEPTTSAEAVDKSQALLFNMHRPEASAVRSLDEGLNAWLDAVEERIENGGRIEHTSGFIDLDEKLGGLAPSRLTVLAARPAMGKTSLSGAIASNVALDNRPVLFVSVEMSFEELLSRFIAQHSGISGTRINRGRLADRDWPAVNRAIGTVQSLPIDVIDIGTATLMTIRSAARRVLAKRGDLGLIVVDYIQLMTGRANTDNRQTEVAEIARGLKIIARELKVPVLALSQLNRNLEYRAEKRPTLGDLRESGEIENSADAVVALYRDEVYNSESKDRGVAELIILKNRHGETGTVTVGADMKTGGWQNLVQRGQQQPITDEFEDAANGAK